jgi:two-component system sensor kinase FixL
MAVALAHELNQPLAAAANSVNAARRVAMKMRGAKAVKLIQVMDEAAENVLRGGQIIRSMRDFMSRGDADRQAETVATLIEESTALALIGQAVKVHPCYQLQPAARCVHVDRVQILQVLVNLIRNALEAMQGSAVRRLTIGASLIDEATVEIAIADTGGGLSPDVALHLFEPFVSTRPGGMGLGLSICRTIVEAHGGRLGAMPNPGGGTVFRFTVPAAPTVT